MKRIPLLDYESPRPPQGWLVIQLAILSLVFLLLIHCFLSLLYLAIVSLFGRNPLTAHPAEYYGAGSRILQSAGYLGVSILVAYGARRSIRGFRRIWTAIEKQP